MSGNSSSQQSDERVLDDFETLQDTIEKSKHIHDDRERMRNGLGKLKRPPSRNSGQDDDYSDNEEYGYQKDDKHRQNKGNITNNRIKHNTLPSFRNSVENSSNPYKYSDDKFIKINEEGKDDQNHNGVIKQGNGQKQRGMPPKSTNQRRQRNKYNDANQEDLKYMQDSNPNLISAQDQNPFLNDAKSDTISINPISGTQTPQQTPNKSSDVSENSNKFKNALKSLNASFNMPDLQMAPETNPMYSYGLGKYQNQDDEISAGSEVKQFRKKPRLDSHNYNRSNKVRGSSPEDDDTSNNDYYSDQGTPLSQSDQSKISPMVINIKKLPSIPKIPQAPNDYETISAKKKPTSISNNMYHNDNSPRNSPSVGSLTPARSQSNQEDDEYENSQEEEYNQDYQDEEESEEAEKSNNLSPNYGLQTMSPITPNGMEDLADLGYGSL